MIPTERKKSIRRGFKQVEVEVEFDALPKGNIGMWSKFLLHW